MSRKARDRVREHCDQIREKMSTLRQRADVLHGPHADDWRKLADSFDLMIAAVELLVDEAAEVERVANARATP